MYTAPGILGLEAWPRPRGLNEASMTPKFCGLGLEGPGLGLGLEGPGLVNIPAGVTCMKVQIVPLYECSVENDATFQVDFILVIRDVNEARILEAEAEAEARTLEAEAEAEAKTLEAEAEARTLEAKAEAKIIWSSKFNKF